MKYTNEKTKLANITINEEIHYGIQIGGTLQFEI